VTHWDGTTLACDSSGRAGEVVTLSVVSPEELIAEGRQLARPVVLLSDAGSEYSGIWGGEGIVAPSNRDLPHRLTIDLSRVPAGGLNGCLSVYSDGVELGECSASPLAPLPIPTSPTGVRLYAREHVPPTDRRVCFVAAQPMSKSAAERRTLLRHALPGDSFGVGWHVSRRRLERSVIPKRK
jgi:hypothetical protein